MGTQAGQPAALSVSPASQKFTGHPVTIRVFDYGTNPIRVNSSTLLLGKDCSMARQTGMTVTPSSFTLKPGQAEEVKVTTPAAKGDYGVLFQPTEIGANASLTVSGAVGSQVLSGNAISCAPPRKQPVAAPAGHSSGLNPVYLAAIIAVALILLIGAGVFIRTRHRGAHI